jgi:hypothetical protein
MRSHIFTRLGYWKESIAAHRASAKAAADSVFDGHHAHDCMVYAYLQLAQDKAARQAMAESLAKKPIDHFAAAFAYAAMPVRMPASCSPSAAGTARAATRWRRRARS